MDYITNSDIIVLGWLSQLREFCASDISVLYWEQGSEYLFGDIYDYEKAELINNYLKQCYSVPCAITSVSPFVSKFLKSK